MLKLVLEKAEEPETHMPTILDHWKNKKIPEKNKNKNKKQQQPKNKNKQTNKKNTYFCFIDYAKALDCVYHYKLWKILEEMEIEEHLSCLWRNN